jgi:hypothetical protein
MTLRGTELQESTSTGENTQNDEDAKEVNPLKELIDCGNRAFEVHSWRLDEFDSLVAHFASLQQLWWYRSSLFTVCLHV